MTQPFTRTDVYAAEPKVLNRGRFANARVMLFHWRGSDWVVKDFRPKFPLIRMTLGHYFLRRELSAMQRLQGVDGVPQDAFRVDRDAIAYRHQPGCVLHKLPRVQLSPDFFPALERLVIAMHQRGVAHLDLRYRHNILVREDGSPGLIDFQTYVCLEGLPLWLQNHFKRTDLSGVYKHWSKRAPGNFDSGREALLRRQNRLRRLWILKGYLGLTRKGTHH